MENKYNFAWPVTVMSYEDYITLKECIDKNQNKIKNKSLVIFGAGIRGSVFAAILEKENYPFFYFADNNSKKWGGYINSHPILPLKEVENNVDKFAIIISVENCDSIKTQLSNYGYIEDVNFFCIKTNIYNNYLNEFKRKTPFKVLALGDCGLSQISINDIDPENLGSMIRRTIGDNYTKVLAMHGMGMRSFYTVYKTQIEMGIIPEVLVLMINFEVFTGKHHILPRTQHVELFKLLDNFVGSAFDELREYVKIVEERFAKLKLDVFNSSDQSVNIDQNSVLVFRKNYMYRLRGECEDVEYLLKILDFSIQEGIKVLPFIPPANYMYAEQLLGEKFKNAYEDNRKKMISLINDKGFEVLDLSYILTSDCFADKKTIDETANYKGRLIVLDKIVESLRTMI